MPVGTTEKKLLEELVKAAGGSKHSSNLQESFDKLANNIKLKAVIIDEFHHLLGTQKNNLVVCLNQLKRITSIPKLSLIISGTPKIARVLEFDDQFESRFRRVVLPNWCEDAEFKKFVVNLSLIHI